MACLANKACLALPSAGLQQGPVGASHSGWRGPRRVPLERPAADERTSGRADARTSAFGEPLVRSGEQELVRSRGVVLWRS